MSINILGAGAGVRGFCPLRRQPHAKHVYLRMGNYIVRILKIYSNYKVHMLSLGQASLRGAKPPHACPYFKDIYRYDVFTKNNGKHKLVIIFFPPFLF